MKIVYLAFTFSCLYAFFSECSAKESVVYEYDAAGNRTARYIVAEETEVDAQAGALRGAIATLEAQPQEESVITLGDLEVDVYPNPTNGPVAIDINLSAYPDGQYIVVLTSGAKNSTSFKVIKENF